MPTDAPLQKIADLLHSRLSLRLVYGEPVREGDRTVIPVARVAFAFGAGGGGGHRHAEPGEATGTEGAAEGYGSGGGGGAQIVPVGALEIGPGGVRFVRFRPLAQLLGAAGAGLALGWVLGRRL